MTTKRIAGHFRIPLILHASLLAMIALFHLHSSATITNILSLIFADIALLLFFLSFKADERRAIDLINHLPAALISLFVVALAFSVLGSGVIAMDNPIHDLLNGERFRLLSLGYGHSVAIDIALILLLIAASGLEKFAKNQRLAMAAFAALLFVLTRTATGIACELIIGFIYLVERNREITVRTRNSILLAAGLIAAAAYFFVLNDMLLYLRALQGVDLYTYGNDDLTAGRALLNEFLIRTANEHPFAGGGRDIWILQGISSDNGSLLAQGESGFRTAATYGWLFWSSTLLIALSPLRIAFTTDRNKRIFCLGLSACVTLLFFGNGTLQNAHDYSTVLYLPLLMIFSDKRVTGAQVRRLRFLRRAPSRSPQRVADPLET